MRRIGFYWMLLIVLSAARSVSADKLVLTTGEALSGEIMSQDQQAVTLMHPVLGALTIQREHIAQIEVHQQGATIEKPTQSPAPAEQSPTDPPVKQSGDVKSDMVEGAAPSITPGTTPGAVTPGAAKSLLEGWKTKLEVSFSGQEGNKQSNTIRLGLATKRQTSNLKLNGDSVVYIESKEHDTTTEEATVGGKMEWPMNSGRWFGFVQGRWDYDRFEAWDYRVTMAGGGGVHLIHSDPFTFTVRAGGGFNKEFGRFADELIPEALGGLMVDWKINSILRFTGETTYFPDLSGTDEWRVVTEAALTLDLHQGGGIKFKVGVHDEYESHTEDDTRHNDFRYFGALVFEF